MPVPVPCACACASWTTCHLLFLSRISSFHFLPALSRKHLVAQLTNLAINSCLDFSLLLSTFYFPPVPWQAITSIIFSRKNICALKFHAFLSFSHFPPLCQFSAPLSGWVGPSVPFYHPFAFFIQNQRQVDKLCILFR